MHPPVARWGVAAEICPLRGGHRNLAFRTRGLRRNLVFKSTRRSPEATAWLGEVHRIARQAGFVVPERIESLEGRPIEDGWTCEVFVEGRAFSPEEVPAIRPLIHAFHRATTDLPQRPGFLSSGDLLEDDCGGDVDLAAMPEALVARCRAAWRAVADRPRAVIHGDLNAGNLIRCGDGRAALIDWDECRRDLVLFDLEPLQPGDGAAHRARLAWEVACSWRIEPDYARRIAAQL